MNIKLLRTVFTLIALLGASVAVYAQDETPPKAVAYTTAPKLVIGKLKNNGQDVYDVRGKATFTILAANSDDTIAGVLTYTIPDDARQKIATLTGKAVSAVPATITKKDAIAGFQKGTAAPVVHLEIAPTELDIAGAKMALSRVTLDVEYREGPNPAPKYTKEEIAALVATWARQINDNKLRRGIISRMNKVINGEP